MQLPDLVSGELPTYHEGMLIVKVRPSVAPLAAMAATPAAAETFSPAPGLSALSTLERAGLIKRVIPLAQPAEGVSPLLGMRSAVAAVAATAERAPTADPNSGVSIVELERDSDVPNLQLTLASDPSVEFVSRVPIRYLAADARPRPRTRGAGATIAAAPPPASTMWNLRTIRWAEARALPSFDEAEDIRVAVLDTGIDADHPDLRGRVTHYAFAHPDFPQASGQRDIIGHGTHVAGTIGAVINNTLGINGICACQLLAWKIFDDRPDFSRAHGRFVYFVDPVMYRRALAECLDLGVDVVNLSIGGPGRPDAQESALFTALLAGGTVVVAAMGNERRVGSPISFPAAIPGVIAVGATSLDDRVADFSNRGTHISVCAPGVAIWSTVPTYPGQTGFEAIPGPGGRPIEGRPLRRETDYAAWPGTSMASPHVAGAVALLLANKGRMNAAAARAELRRTAVKVPGMGGLAQHPDYGAGRLDLFELLR